MKIETTLIKIVADNGKTFARKDSGEILGREIWLGKEESPDNFIEIDIPVETEAE